MATALVERYIDDGQANGSISVKLTATGLAAAAGLCFRRASDNTALVIYRDNSSFTGYRFVRKNTANNEYRTIDTCRATPAAVSDVIKVVLNGSSLTFVLNGAVISTVTNLTNQTATQHGIWCLGGAANATWDSSYTNSLVTPRESGHRVAEGGGVGRLGAEHAASASNTLESAGVLVALDARTRNGLSSWPQHRV